jgi:hypothetical protein
MKIGVTSRKRKSIPSRIEGCQKSCESLRTFVGTSPVFTADLEAAAGNAGCHLQMLIFVPEPVLHGERAEVLTRVPLSRTVPSSSVSFAAMTIIGLNSLGPGSVRALVDTLSGWSTQCLHGRKPFAAGCGPRFDRRVQPSRRRRSDRALSSRCDQHTVRRWRARGWA